MQSNRTQSAFKVTHGLRHGLCRNNLEWKTVLNALLQQKGNIVSGCQLFIAISCPIARQQSHAKYRYIKLYIIRISFQSNGIFNRILTDVNAPYINTPIKGLTVATKASSWHVH